MIFINTGIYIRVSTEEQVNNGYSIRAQEEKLVSFCKIKDWNIYNIYITKKGIQLILSLNFYSFLLL